MTEFSYNLNQLTCLLADSDFKTELVALRRAFQRLKVRLRNNLLTCKLKQLATLTRKFEVEFPSLLASNYGDRVKTLTGKRQENAFKSLHKFITQLILFLDLIIEKTIHIYSYTQPHFKLGHLIHHLIFVRVSVSRLRVCFKALLIYACDLMIELSKNSLMEKIEDNVIRLSRDDIHAILKRNDCKPRIEQVIDVNQEDEADKNGMLGLQSTSGHEEIGVLINRDHLKPEVPHGEKPKARKKAKHR